MSGEVRVRHVVRVLLLDEEDRLLLFRSVSRAWWQPPGGGIEDGEDVRVAALRELAEETGLRELELGAEVWRRNITYAWNGIRFDQRERWLLARCGGFEPDLGGLSASERADLAEWRWWSPDELEATCECLVPRDLARRLGTLLEHGPPPAPVDVGR